MDIFLIVDKVFVLFIVLGVIGVDEIFKVLGTCKRMYLNLSINKFY